MFKTVAAAAIAASVIASPIQARSEPIASPPAASPPAAPAPATTSAPSSDAPHILYIVIDMKEKKPLFTASSIGTAETGVLGSIAAVSAGADIVKQYNIPDPAIEVSRRLADLLAAKHGGIVDAPMVIELGKPSPEYHGAAQYSVMTVTTAWGYSWAAMTDLSHYVATYRAQVIIGDKVSGKPPVKVTCKVTPFMGGASLDHDHLFADNATGLKSLLIGAAQNCVEQVKAATPALQ